MTDSIEHRSVRRAKGTRRLVGGVALVALALLAACAPPVPERAWRHGSANVEGQVTLPGTAGGWPMAFGPASSGGVLVGFTAPAPGGDGPWPTWAMRVGSDGGVRYRVDAGTDMLLGTASRGAVDLFVGSHANAEATGTVTRPVIRRYTSSGQPDLTFGEGGVVSLPLPEDLPSWNLPPGRADAAAIDATGRTYVLVAHTVDISAPSAVQRISVVRLTPDGSLDTQWGDDGWVHLGLSSVRNDPAPGSILLDPDGSVTVAAAGFGSLSVGRISSDGGTTEWAGGVSAGSSPISSECVTFGNISSPGMADAGGRTLLSLTPSMRCHDPGVVAIHDDIVDDQGTAAIDRSFGDDGALTWRIEDDLSTPVRAVGGVFPLGNGRFAVPVLDGDENPGLVEFDSTGSLTHPELPGGVRVLRVESDASAPVQYWPRNPSPYGLLTGSTRLGSAVSDTLYLVGTLVDAPAEGIVVVRVWPSAL
jgi:hypothetical protein